MLKPLNELKINLQNPIISAKLKKEGIEKEYTDLKDSLNLYIKNMHIKKIANMVGVL